MPIIGNATFLAVLLAAPGAVAPPAENGGGPFMPVSVAVDPAGNSVLEPNETVVVAPTWRNLSTVAWSFSGVSSGFTGPAGPVYANPDTIANYPLLLPSGTGTCSDIPDCYMVRASAATRPVTHWDSTLHETGNGFWEANWTLHVGGSFTDVSVASPFYRFVETILHKNVTSGCGGGAYCPSASTAREQMTVFVLVAREPAGYVPPACGGTPMFADVPVTSPFCRWVEELARRGVTSGCGPGLYCPSATVSREQLAVFVLRTLDPAFTPPACGAPMFADVPASSPFCRWIEELARRGVAGGCGGGNYCPAVAVSREQMAVFLSGAFSLRLY